MLLSQRIQLSRNDEHDSHKLLELTAKELLVHDRQKELLEQVTQLVREEEQVKQD